MTAASHAPAVGGRLLHCRMVLVAVLEQRLIVVNVRDKDDDDGCAGVDGATAAVTARAVIGGRHVHLRSRGHHRRSPEVTGGHWRSREVGGQVWSSRSPGVKGVTGVMGGHQRSREVGGGRHGVMGGHGGSGEITRGQVGTGRLGQITGNVSAQTHI